MQKNDLTRVKYIGAGRMKSLNDAGIITIQQLSKTPLEKLARIGNIGEHYAKLIKEAIRQLPEEKPAEMAPQTGAGKVEDTERVGQDLGTQIKALKKQLRNANERLKPLGKKKCLSLYIEFKKRSKTLKAGLDGFKQTQGELSHNVTKKIAANVEALTESLKNLKEKPKKKIYKKLAREIQQVSKVLKKAGS